MCVLEALLGKTSELKHEKTGFALYKLPNTKTIVLGYDDGITAKKGDEKVFIFSPFDDNKPSIRIAFTKILTATIKETSPTHQRETTINDDETAKKQHLALVDKTIDVIKKGHAQKIVVACQKKVATQKGFTDIFKTFLALYPESFTYVFYHPSAGLWMGATPETLLDGTAPQYQTVALAGTQPFKKDMPPVWQPKEIEEQAMVTAGILKNLTSSNIKAVVGQRKHVRAGNLWHLYTPIDFKTTINRKALLGLLHPTAAVCGLPTTTAKHFILENEHFSRDFYTGFMGIENPKNKEIKLFVNLRCLKLSKGIATLYAGGGITKDSRTEKEWEEVNWKLQTTARCL